MTNEEKIYCSVEQKDYTFHEFMANHAEHAQGDADDQPVDQSAQQGPTWEKTRTFPGAFITNGYPTPDPCWRVIARFEREEDADRILALEAENASLKQWKEALRDIGVVNWTLTSENNDDPRKLILETVQELIHEQLDPTISEQAAEVKRLRTEIASLKRRDELAEDLWDWALRWQQGRIHNSNTIGEPDHAHIILGAMQLNGELDALLDDYITGIEVIAEARAALAAADTKETPDKDWAQKIETAKNAREQGAYLRRTDTKEADNGV